MPEAIVGVGTVLEPAQFFAATEVGARFAVSPGATERLLDAVQGHAVPYLPGIATPAEAMTLIERGYRFAKFFPAEPAGGARYLSALASPLPQLRFCPTGGISPANAAHYLVLPNVVCVGGSWMVGSAVVAAGDWTAVTAAAAAACALAPR